MASEDNATPLGLTLPPSHHASLHQCSSLVVMAPGCRSDTGSLHSPPGLGSTPHLSVDGYQDGGIHVVCESAGWYPEPRVLWRDLSGQRLAPAMEKISQQADGLFDTHIAAVITDASNQNLSCSVLNPRLGQEKTATMHIAGPGPAFGKMAPLVTLYFGTLAPMDTVSPYCPDPRGCPPIAPGLHRLHRLPTAPGSHRLFPGIE